MKWIANEYGVYCPSCVEMREVTGELEPDFQMPGQDHCSICGMEYFNTPPGIFDKLKNELTEDDWVMNGEYKLKAIQELKDWYELHPGYTKEFMSTLQEILKS